MGKSSLLFQCYYGRLSECEVAPHRGLALRNVVIAGAEQQKPQQFAAIERVTSH